MLRSCCIKLASTRRTFLPELILKFFLGTMCVSLVSCAMESNEAPVSDLNAIASLHQTKGYRAQNRDFLRPEPQKHIIQKTQPPQATQTGWVLSKSATISGAATATSKPKSKTSKNPIKDATYDPNSVWIWPAYGNVITPFTQLNKGLNIASTVGACAYASASGVVVYSGDALKAYGNLIIVKHNAEFLSAYAYVSQILVKEGQQVTKGQCIAKMGATDSRKAMLHFEIRHRGQPVNPLSYLPRK